MSVFQNPSHQALISMDLWFPIRNRLDMVCVGGERSQEMHSLAADECDGMSFCLFKVLDFDLYGVFHSLLYVCLH